MTVNFEITQGDPPKKIGAPMKYPWDKMKVGDKLFVPLDEVSKESVNAVRTTAKSWFDKNRPEVAVSVYVNHERGGCDVYVYKEEK